MITPPKQALTMENPHLQQENASSFMTDFPASRVSFRGVYYVMLFSTYKNWGPEGWRTYFVGTRATWWVGCGHCVSWCVSGVVATKKQICIAQIHIFLSKTQTSFFSHPNLLERIISNKIIQLKKLLESLLAITVRALKSRQFLRAMAGLWFNLKWIWHLTLWCRFLQQQTSISNVVWPTSISVGGYGRWCTLKKAHCRVIA